ncbi:unsaturated chondroitin disaccharide hydrolase [Paenibacillus sp. UNCCL117]|uniref:glycoside hydrolase family 88 protein n=1 Tax=unclassified Paenibacillus TaxID=185978 RepID=UPI000880F37A|nr:MULTISPECIES: glycoside hydrolase family 88 protein [unclassified Paenibacillus]SDD76383.1 unsaturated chondroitin disaccharide hydrolase [Paenibacillus sp. cl123]SFW52426.1 unsaturated chondroitin disaccharide hydrolase [Paenibacillus sp. UNCCL117]
MKQVRDEGHRFGGKYAQAPELSAPWLEEAVQFVLKQIDRNLQAYAHRFPSPSSKGNVYESWDNVEWTPGFWTGMLWLAYELTGEAKYRETAEGQLESYQTRLQERKHTATHDLGFLYTLSCVSAYKLTGSETAKRTALLAADLLMERYFEQAGIIQAWGNLDDPKQRGRMIIDCCMNLPLLYWAGEMTGDRRYARAADSHVRQAAAYLVREDASTYHTFYMDVETGEPRYGKTQQGYSDDSCWSRGQAWAIYGFALGHRYTGDDRLLDIGQKVTHYFLNRLPKDDVCYWDLIFTEGSEERDSSAAAIAASGMLELAGRLPEGDANKRLYEHAALHILRSLAERYTAAADPSSNGVLLHAVYGKPLGHGVDECCIWGDYYYFETLVRSIKDWKTYW